MELTDPVTGLPVNLSDPPAVIADPSADPSPVEPLVEEVKVEEIVEEKPKETVHYVHGSPVSITDEQKAKLDQLTQELNDSGNGLVVSEIPVGHAYWSKKAELDAFVSALKH